MKGQARVSPNETRSLCNSVRIKLKKNNSSQQEHGLPVVNMIEGVREQPGDSSASYSWRQS